MVVILYTSRLLAKYPFSKYRPWPFQVDSNLHWPPTENDQEFSKWNLSLINIVNKDESCDCSNFAHLNGGGPGKNFALIRFWAERGCPINVTMEMYGFDKFPSKKLK